MPKPLIVRLEPVPEDERLRFLGPVLSGPPGERSGTEAAILLVDPAVPGVLSDFHSRGQYIRWGGSLDDIVGDATVAAEFRVLAERLCFRHGLDSIECTAEPLMPVLELAAQTLGLKCRLISPHRID